MESATLIRHQIVQVSQAHEKSLLPPIRVMETFHHKQFPIESIVGLVQDRAHRWHLRIGKHRIPARFLGLKPMAHARTVLFTHRRGEVLGEMAEALAERHHAEACTLPTPVEHAVQGGAPPLTQRSRMANELVRSLWSAWRRQKPKRA